jgi:hypothetical protein
MDPARMDRNQIFVAPASRRRFCEMWSTEESPARCRRAAFDPNVKDNTAEGAPMRARMAALFDVEQRKVTEFWESKQATVT